jgi:hypothetical protein
MNSLLHEPDFCLPGDGNIYTYGKRLLLHIDQYQDYCLVFNLLS